MNYNSEKKKLLQDLHVREMSREDESPPTILPPNLYSARTKPSWIQEKFRVEKKYIQKVIDGTLVGTLGTFQYGILENILYGAFREMAHSDHFL
jgi:hypothetical protein